MPLELWLTRNGLTSWDPVALVAFLIERRHWQIDEGWAIHEHPDSGVQCSLIWQPPNGADPEAWAGGARLLVRLNLVRPRYFGLAAAELLTTLLARFPARVDLVDPWSSERFVELWDGVNREAFARLEDRAGLSGYPGPALESIWRWNDRRQWLQTLVPELFVAKIGFTEVEGRARSTVIWTDLVPAVIPVVDRVLVLRSSPPNPGLVELSSDRLADWLPPPARVPHVALPHRVVGQPHRELGAWVGGQGNVAARWLAIASVVDDEYL